MASHDDLYEELKQIQNIIDRLASNSFKIKGWTIAVIVAALIFRGEDYQVLISFLPLFAFWYLDAYYLYKERLYRELYDWVRENRLENKKYYFDMDTSRFTDEVKSPLRLMFNHSTLVFYGGILLILVSYSFSLLVLNIL